MKDKIKKIIIAILIFSLYFLFPYLIELIIDILKIDINSWQRVYRIIFIYSLDVIPLIILVIIYKNILIEDFHTKEMKVTCKLPKRLNLHYDYFELEEKHSPQKRVIIPVIGISVFLIYLVIKTIFNL